MDALIELVNTFTNDPVAFRWIVIVCTGLAFAALTIGLGYLLFNSTDPVRRRVGILSSENPSAGQRSREGFLVKIDTFMGPVAQWVLPREELERSEIKRNLTHAGFRRQNALQIFYAIKIVLATGLPILVFAFSSFFPQITTTTLSFLALSAAGVGLLGPSLVLDKAIAKRMKLLRNGFPDALDLLVVCVESGLGLAQAIQRVADELIVSHPELAAELALVNAEIRAGVDRVDALKNLSERTGLDDIKGLVSLLIQTLRFGTSIADTLRVYSEEFRDKRMQRAEEMAAKIGTKMIFPLVLFMFPAFFVIAVGPAAIRLVDAFARM